MKWLCMGACVAAASAQLQAQNFATLNKADMDLTVQPGEDFFQYAGGGWMKSHPLTAEFSQFGTFTELNEQNNLKIKQLFADLCQEQHAPGSVGQKVKDLYNLAMDSVRLTKEGVLPLKQDLLEVNQVNRKDFCSYLAKIHLALANPFFGIGVESDMLNSSINVLYMSAGTMSLPDRDYYLKTDEKNKQVQEKYRECIQKMFIYCGYTAKEAKRVAKTVYDIEYNFAQASMTRAEQRDLSKLYNVRTIEQLQKDYPALNWQAYFKAMGLPTAKQVILTQPKVMAVANDYMTKMTDQQIADYVSWCVMKSAAGTLCDEFAEISFDFFGRTLNGQKERSPRWKRSINTVNGVLGEAVGELYVKQYFPESSKTKVRKLVANLRKSLGEHIANLKWMSDSTKINALLKLNAFGVKVGYPDQWRDYSQLTIDANKSYYENMKAAGICETQRQLARMDKPVDKEEWFMTPQTVNAYYNPSANEIVFPAAILQPPFFYPDGDDAINYGGIGVVIGHEMTHGFDDQGSHFDAEGNMRDWWLEKDRAKFKEITKVLVDQFNAIEITKDLHANGELTLGENIADQGGLCVAYDAWKKTEQAKSGSPIDGLTPEQRFYISYGHIWANNITEENIYNRTKTDPHSLGRWRVNATLRNLETFFQAFNIKEGDKMFRPKSERVIIW